MKPGVCRMSRVDAGGADAGDGRQAEAGDAAFPVRAFFVVVCVAGLRAAHGFFSSVRRVGQLAVSGLYDRARAALATDNGEAIGVAHQFGHFGVEAAIQRVPDGLAHGDGHDAAFRLRHGERGGMCRGFHQQDEIVGPDAFKAGLAKGGAWRGVGGGLPDGLRDAGLWGLGGGQRGKGGRHQDGGHGCRMGHGKATHGRFLIFRLLSGAMQLLCREEGPGGAFGCRGGKILLARVMGPGFRGIFACAVPGIA